MKRIHTLTLILTTLLLSSCQLMYTAADTSSPDINSLAPSVDTAVDEPAVYWENRSYIVTDQGGGFTLCRKSNGAVVREYSDLRTLSRLETDGTVTEITLAVVLSSNGTPTLWSLDADEGERRLISADDSIVFYGDFIIIDRTLYTSSLRRLGSIYASLIPQDLPAYNEMPELSEPDSHITVRTYLAGVTERGVQLPLPDDTTEYTDIRSVGGGRYIGIFEEDGVVMSRYFFADLGHTTPLGAYVYECTSPAILMGRVFEFDRYRSINTEWLVDSDGSFRLFAEGVFEVHDGYIQIHPFDVDAPMTFYTPELELLCDNVFSHIGLSDSRTLVWHSNRIYGKDKNGGDVIHDNHMLSVIDSELNITAVTECDEVFALTTFGALISHNGEAMLITSEGDVLAELAGWKAGLEYGGRAVGTEPKYSFVFSDVTDTDKNSDPLRRIWCYDSTDGTVEYTEYYGSFPDGFTRQGTEH